MVYAGHDAKKKDGWTYPAGGDDATVIVDPDGNVLAHEMSDRALEESIVGDMLVMFAASVAIGVVRSGVSGLVAAAGTLASNAPRQLLPALKRLIETQGKGFVTEVMKRTPQAIAKPTIFRHSLTSEVKEVAYARIMKEGSLRFSKASNAHYGEGVYAWGEGAQGVGKYIDIEVAPGAAFEAIVVKGQGKTVYRLMSESGDRLAVKIVGTNLSEAEIELGFKLLGKSL